MGRRTWALKTYFGWHGTERHCRTAAATHILTEQEAEGQPETEDQAGTEG